MTIPPPIICLKDECPTPSLCFEHGEECQKNESDPQRVALARKGRGGLGRPLCHVLYAKPAS